MSALMALWFAALAPAQAKDAEQWFRALEQTVATAKTLKMVCKTSVEIGNNGYRVDVKLWAAQGNRLRIDAVAAAGAKKDKEIVVVGEGKQLAVSLSAVGGADVRAVEADYTQKLLEMLVYSSVGAALDEVLRPGSQPRPGEIELSKFKLGAKEKMDKRESQMIEYELVIKERQGVLKVKLWIDTQTLLPVRRVMTIGTGAAEARFTEVFSEFTLNPALDAKLFELPK